MKKSAAVEHVAEPPPEPSQRDLDKLAQVAMTGRGLGGMISLTQSELERTIQRRLTEDSIGFLERLFPDPTKRNWLQVCSGTPESFGGGTRGMETCRYLHDQWIMLGHAHSSKEAPQTLADWLEGKRLYTEVRFCPTLATIPSDQAPLHPLTTLFCRVPVAVLPHAGSAGAFSVAHLTKIAAVKQRLFGLDPRPSLMVNEWDGVSAYWGVDEGVEPDLAAAWLNKVSMIARGTSLTPRSFMLLPGQAPKRIIPFRCIEVTEDSGAVYSKQDIATWLGEGMPIKSKEETLRDAAVRRYA